MILESLLARPRPAAAEETAGGSLTDRGWITSLIAGSGGVSTSGQAVTPWTAEGIPAVYACQRAISETAGQIPLKLKRYTDNGKVDARDLALYSVLHDLANPEMTAYHFKEMMTRHLVGWGNAYAEIIRDGAGRVTALWPLMPWRMTVDRDDTNNKRWVYQGPGGRLHTWRWHDSRPPILHLMVNSVDGLSGRSPIKVLMDAVGATQAVNQFGMDWFAGYATPAGVLTHPQKLSPQARQHLREEWEKKHGTWGNKHRVAILQEGMTFSQMSSPPEEAQFIESKGFQISEMCRMYRVPPFMVGHMEKATTWGSGIEQMMLGWLSTGLQPYLVGWKQSLARDCLTAKSFNTHTFVWVERALLRADFKTRMQGYEIQQRIGAATPNEFREWEDLNRRTDPYGDEFMVPTNNMAPSSLAREGAAPASTDPDDDEGDE